MDFSSETDRINISRSLGRPVMVRPSAWDHAYLARLITRVTLAVLDLLHDLREVVARRRLHRRKRLERLKPLEPQLLDGQQVPVVDVGGARRGRCAAQARCSLRVEADCLFERVALDVLHPRPVELNERQQPAGRSIFWRRAAASSHLLSQELLQLRVLVLSSAFSA
jgi:hypothetical protein